MPYTSIRDLGSGQFGVVTLERDEGLDRLCAAKRVAPTGRHRYAEPQAMLAMSHDNVVQIYSVDEDPVTGDLIIRMEYHEPGSLHDVYETVPRTTGSVMLHVEQACRGLQHLHSQETLHRDVKPANLLLSVNDVVMLCDFGLSESLSSVGTQTPVGYLAHLPPESVNDTGEITAATGDVYAMGVTLYRLLEGDDWLESMWNMDRFDFLQAIEAGKVPPDRYSPHVHSRLRSVIRKATRPRPGDRYQSATDLRHALELARPAVSWYESSRESDTIAWIGSHLANGSTYVATVQIGAGSRWSFEITKTFPSGTDRRLRRLEESRLTKTQAINVARRVMNNSEDQL